jgi:hypothetical protein
MYGKPAMTRFKIRCTCVKSSHTVYECNSSDCPHPILQAALPPLYGSITFTHVEENSRTLVWLNYPTYVKKQRGHLNG